MPLGSNVVSHAEVKATPKAFALLLSTTEHGPDVELSVRMKSISEEEREIIIENLP